MKSDEKNKKITPASHGDELDVLKALYQMERAGDKNLLSDEQRELYESALGHQASDKPEKKIDSKKLLLSMVDVLEKSLLEDHLKDVKEDLSEQEKSILSESLFKLSFGQFPDYYKLSIIKIFGD